MLSSGDPAIDAAANAGIAAGRYIADDTVPYGLRKGPSFVMPLDPEHAAMQVRLDAICEVNDQ